MKGQSVAVSGSVSEREWKTKEGEPKKSMEIRVNDVALQGGQRQQSESAPAPKAAPRPTPKTGGGSSGFDDMDSDIPFRDPLAYRGVHLAV